MGQKISYPHSLQRLLAHLSTFLLSVLRVLTVCDKASFSAGHRITIERKHCHLGCFCGRATDSNNNNNNVSGRWKKALKNLMEFTSR